MLIDSFPEIEQKRIPFQIMSLAQFRPEKNHKEGKNNYFNGLVFYFRKIFRPIRSSSGLILTREVRKGETYRTGKNHECAVLVSRRDFVQKSREKDT